MRLWGRVGAGCVLGLLLQGSTAVAANGWWFRVFETPSAAHSHQGHVATFTGSDVYVWQGQTSNLVCTAAQVAEALGSYDQLVTSVPMTVDDDGSVYRAFGFRRTQNIHELVVLKSSTLNPAAVHFRKVFHAETDGILANDLELNRRGSVLYELRPQNPDGLYRVEYDGVVVLEVPFRINGMSSVLNFGGVDLNSRGSLDDGTNWVYVLQRGSPEPTPEDPLYRYSGSTYLNGSLIHSTLRTYDDTIREPGGTEEYPELSADGRLYSYRTSFRGFLSEGEQGLFEWVNGAFVKYGDIQNFELYQTFTYPDRQDRYIARCSNQRDLRNGPDCGADVVLRAGDPLAGDVVRTTVIPRTRYGAASRAINARGELLFVVETVGGRYWHVLATREPPHPVIFIHGVAGSVLKHNGQYIWPTVSPLDVAQMHLQDGPPGLEAVDVVREYDVGGLGVEVLQFYGPFLRHMVERRGYTEFLLEEERARLTNFFMIHQSFPKKPDLFTYPYDWRRPNAEHVATLHTFIQRIRQLHEGAKVSLVVHSMGGLVMRRYLLDHGSESIARVVTVGSPIWGAPEASFRMLTGQFFPVGAVDFINSKAMKKVVLTMPAIHELMPSTRYFENWGFPLLEEDGFDFNGNGVRDEGYDMAQFRVALDEQAHPQTPSLNSIQFHAHQGGRQDDWSQDDDGLPFLHIIGKQAVDVTTVGIRVAQRTFVTPVTVLATPEPLTTITRIAGEGDGTVPTLSSQRLASYRTPGAQVREIHEPQPNTPSDDQPEGASAEHTGLMSNTRVWGLINEFLDSGTLSSGPSVTAASARTATAFPRDASSELGEALGAPDLNWTTDGDAPWFAQSVVSLDGIDAAQTGVIGSGQYSALATQIEGPGELVFFWLLDSEDPQDALRFTVNGDEVSAVPALFGVTDWMVGVVMLPPGVNNLRWIYERPLVGGAVGAGVHTPGTREGQVNAGWLDRIQFTPIELVSEISLTRIDGSNLVSGVSTQDFGHVRAGAESSMSLIISSVGTASLTNMVLSVSGPFAADYIVDPAYIASLGAGMVITGRVTFAPQPGVEGVRPATFTLTSNDEDESPFVLALTGTTPTGRTTVQVAGCGYVGVTDAQDRTNTRFSSIAARQVPGVEVIYGGDEDWVRLDFSSELPLHIESSDGCEHVEVEVVVRDHAGGALSVSRYRVQGATNGWRLALAPALDPVMAVDTNGNAVFESEEVVPPHRAGVGAAADTLAPSVAMELSLVAGRIVMHLTAEDDRDPTPAIWIGRNTEPLDRYTGPLDLPRDTPDLWRVFAEDAMGNTSGLIETRLTPEIAVGGVGPALTVAWPDVDGFAPETGPSPAGPWSSVPAGIIRNGGIASFEWHPTGVTNAHFRLRAHRIER